MIRFAYVLREDGNILKLDGNKNCCRQKSKWKRKVKEEIKKTGLTEAACSRPKEMADNIINLNNPGRELTLAASVDGNNTVTDEIINIGTNTTANHR